MDDLEVARVKVPIRTEEEIIEYAQRLGCSTVVTGNSHMLLIDCDSEASFNTTLANLRWCKGLIGVTEAFFTRSKSQNYHVYIMLGIDMSQRERALLQAAIGGDFRRAMLDWRRTELAEPMGEATVRKMLTTGKKSEIHRGETVLFETPSATKTKIDLGPEINVNY